MRRITREQIDELERKALLAKRIWFVPSHGAVTDVITAEPVLDLIARNRELEAAVGTSYSTMEGPWTVCQHCRSKWGKRQPPEWHKPNCIVESLEVSHADSQATE